MTDRISPSSRAGTRGPAVFRHLGAGEETRVPDAEMDALALALVTRPARRP